MTRVPVIDICTQYTKSLLLCDINFVFSAVDKCAPVRYNVSTFNRRYRIMAAYSTKKSGYCANSAAACTSARNMDILDTARVVVSILLSPIICAKNT